MAYAKCPLAEAYLKTRKKDKIFEQYKVCAEMFNDSESQLHVGMTYLNGTDFANQSLQSAFKYFRMGAENGYAPAQRELAKLMDALEDMGSDGKEALADFEEQWQKENALERQPLSALAWMTLAAEKSENKWFYDCPAVTDEEAIRLLPRFRSNRNVEASEKQAVAFKQEKLMQQARNLLSDSAYDDFESIIYSEKQKGKVRARMTKAQAIENLKQYKMSTKK